MRASGTLAENGHGTPHASIDGMTQPIPPGCEGFIPHVVCSPCAEAIDFYVRAFGAEEVSRVAAPGDSRIMHAHLSIGGSPLYLVDDFPEFRGGKSGTATALGGTPVTIHRFVEDVDAAFQRAIDAGAAVKMPVSDMFWGDRYGVVTDPYGHVWSLATHTRDLTPDEIVHGMNAAFAEHGPES